MVSRRVLCLIIGASRVTCGSVLAAEAAPGRLGAEGPLLARRREEGGWHMVSGTEKAGGAAGSECAHHAAAAAGSGAPGVALHGACAGALAVPALQNWCRVPSCPSRPRRGLRLNVAWGPGSRRARGGAAVGGVQRAFRAARPSPFAGTRGWERVRAVPAGTSALQLPAHLIHSNPPRLAGFQPWKDAAGPADVTQRLCLPAGRAPTPAYAACCGGAVEPAPGCAAIRN
jgi:hypothetical protein